MRPCPACDVDHSDEPLFCLALGAAMGSAYRDIRDVTNLMCASHRKPWLRAMLDVSRKMRELEETDRQCEDPADD